MPGTTTWLLDTGILLHWVRGSTVAQAIDDQFQLRTAGFRPLICEVSLGEIEAFTREKSWGPEKQEKLKLLKKEIVAVDISDPSVIDAYADLSTLARSKGWAVFHDKNDLWIAASTRVAGATLLSTDRSAFEPLRDGNHLSVVLVDAKTGERLP
jgi:predicted nucleic acid-binding protein